jgi:O-antigen ligase
MPNSCDAPAKRADGATLGAIFALALTAVPARLVLRGLPLSISLAAAVGLLMGTVLFCAHMVPGTGVAKGRNVVRTALLLFATSQLATYGYATLGYLPPDELAAADRTLVGLAAVTAVGLAICDGVRGLDRLDLVLKVLVLGTVITALVGIVQFAFSIDITKYLVFPGLRASGDWSYVLERSIFRRPSGATSHPIEFGVVCAMALPLALHYGFRRIDAGGRGLWWWASVGVLATAAMMSLSRSAILGLGVAGIVLLAAMPGRRRIRSLLLSLGFLLAMRMIVPGLLGTLYSLFANIGNDPSAVHRTMAVDIAGKEIIKHPWLGRGMGTYLPDRYGWLDNQYLGTLVQNGIIGVAALAGLFVAGIFAAFRARLLSTDPVIRDLGVTLVACVLIPTASAATFDLLGFSVATGFTFLILGASGALLRIARERRFEERAGSKSADGADLDADLDAPVEVLRQ